MGLPVLVLGESGSGKTASLRNFKKENVLLINTTGKELPFRNVNGIIKKDRLSYDKIKEYMLKASKTEGTKCKTFIIDDSQYLMAFELFSRAKETGYGKFTDIAIHFKDLIDFVFNELPSDFIVYFLHHVDRGDDGFMRAKTSGKMLDNQLTLEGLFTIVLMTDVTNGTYSFITHNVNGMSTVKTPIGMFESDLIDNDLSEVDKIIREYYGK